VAALWADDVRLVDVPDHIKKVLFTICFIVAELWYLVNS
jgi:hypothetical protein